MHFATILIVVSLGLFLGTVAGVIREKRRRGNDDDK